MTKLKQYETEQKIKRAGCGSILHECRELILEHKKHLSILVK